MNNPTPTDTKPDAKTWLITGAAMTFLVFGVPAIVEAATKVLLP